MIFRASGCITLAFVVGMLISSQLSAATATAMASAVVVSPARVSADASTQWQSSASVGVLMLNIPAGSGVTAAAPLKMTLTTSGEVAWGSPMVFSVSDSVGLAALISQLAISGGSLSVSGTLSGKGMQIVVLQAAQRGDSGTVTAIVTYN